MVTVDSIIQAVEQLSGHPLNQDEGIHKSMTVCPEWH